MYLTVDGVPLAQVEHEPTEETGHTETEEHNPVIPEITELIPALLAFLLVSWVLGKYAIPRLNRAMNERTEKIQGDLEGAERARSEAESELARYQEQLREARGEAGRIIEEARKTAESMRRDLLARAEDESNQIVSRAQEEIRAERDRAFQDLRRQVGEISVELAGRVVGESLDRERHLRLVDAYIDDVAGMGGGNGNGGNGNGGNGNGKEPVRDEGPSDMGYPPRPGEAEGGTWGQRPEEPGG